MNITVPNFRKFMSELEDEKRPLGVVEKHLVTILVSLLTAGVMFMIVDQVNTGKVNARTALQIEVLIAQMAELRGEVSTIRATQTTYARNEQLLDFEMRLRALEAKR